jgi:hypothetical protein
MLSKKLIRRRSMRQERELASATGGRQQRGSGCLPGYKGDVRKRGHFRAECKFTKNKAYRLTKEELSKIRSECSFGETPVLDVTFTDSNGRTDERWVVLPYDEWLRLTRSKDAPDDNQ